MPESPLDELRISADEIWKKVAPGYVLSEAELTTIIAAERAARESWLKKSAKKAVDKEEKDV